MKPENSVGISVFEINAYSQTSVDLSFDDRHVPYVCRVEYEDSVLTVYQSLQGNIPDVKHWPLPGAQEDKTLGLLVSRFPIVDSSCKINYGHPTRFLIWVESIALEVSHE